METAVVQNSPITSWQAILIFFALVGVVLVINTLKKVYYRRRYKKRYFVIPRVGVRGLAYIGMVMAVSVTTILVLSAVSSGAFGTLFRAFPGARVAVEALLIKIGGMIFGPIIGLVIGAAVDILTVALSAGVFHYGYLMAAMAFGLLSGFIRIMITYSRGKDIRFAVFSTVAILVVVTMLQAVLYGTSIFGDTITIKFIGTIAVPKLALALVIGAFFAVLLAAVWGTYLMRYVNVKYGDAFKYFAPVVTMVVISEAIVNLLFLPVFDSDITGNPWSFWFGVRVGTTPIVALSNIIVIYAIYRIVAPLIKYEYEKELVEDLSIPLLSR